MSFPRCMEQFNVFYFYCPMPLPEGKRTNLAVVLLPYSGLLIVRTLDNSLVPFLDRSLKDRSVLTGSSIDR